MRDSRKNIQSGALLAGPLFTAVTLSLPVPQGLTPPALATAAVALWMAIWWMSEAVSLAVTALLPLILFPALGIATIEDTAASYSHPLIFLFLGGFLMAESMQRRGLSERIARRVLGVAGNRPHAIVAGVMAATGFLSMWVSNTATAMMMLPIGQSLVRTLTGGHNAFAPRHTAAFSSALMLGIAYSATIGGMGTLIGTPPNALFASFMEETYGIEISFARWMLIGVPAVLILLPLAWLVLTRVAFSLPPALPGKTVEALAEAVGHTGRMTADETRVAILLLVAAGGWVTRPFLEAAVPWLIISDAGIAISVAIVLFLVPSRSSPGRRLLSWDEARNIRWDVLILFGGGLALAEAIAATGLANWIGSASSIFAMLPWLLLLLVVMTVIVLLGELASNTAVAAVFLPVAGAAAVDLGTSPLLLSISVALAASLGFMLPVATPPNAILYGSGMIKAEDMLRTGILLDLLGIVIVALLVVGIGRLGLGI
jgi:sodium-dependent dicarboxylate transporter 2/3/5